MEQRGNNPAAEARCFGTERHAALLARLLHDFEQIGLRTGIAGEPRCHEIDQLGHLWRLGVADHRVRVMLELALVRGRTREIAQQEVSCRLGVDTRTNVGNRVLVLRVELAGFREPAMQCELVPQRHADRVQEMRVIGGNAVPQLEQRLDERRLGLGPHRLGRTALHERVRIAQARSHEECRDVAKAAALREDALHMGADECVVILVRRGERVLVELADAVQCPQRVHLLSR